MIKVIPVTITVRRRYSMGKLEFKLLGEMASRESAEVELMQ